MSDIESVPVDYTALLKLAESFSDDGVLNLNFLRSLLVQIVEILRRSDEAVKKNGKVQWTQALINFTSTDMAVNFDKQNQCGRTSMHDSLSLETGLHKGHQTQPTQTTAKSQTTKLSQVSAGCQSSILNQHQAVLANPSTKSDASQCDSGLKLSMESMSFNDAGNQCELFPTKLEEVSSQTKSNESHENSTQCQLNEIPRSRDAQQKQFSNSSSIMLKLFELEGNIHAITAATSEIVCEIEKIEGTLIRDSSEIKHVRHSLECLRKDCMRNLLTKENSSAEKAGENNIRAPMSLIDKAEGNELCFVAGN